jgi:hypothetical protein
MARAYLAREDKYVCHLPRMPANALHCSEQAEKSFDARSKVRDSSGVIANEEEVDRGRVQTRILSQKAGKH